LEILILGCGFTGRRVARRFLARGAKVTVTTRDPDKLADLGANAVRLEELAPHLSPGLLVLHSLPPDADFDMRSLRNFPSRMVYLSSTAVYGAATEVDEKTPADESTPRAQARLVAEQSVMDGPWSSLILRPAAIYGPGRGAHEALRRGTYTAGDNFVSRIHVDDLATHIEAGLLSKLTGAFPVADEEPCTTRQIADFCANLLGLPASLSTAPTATRVTGNRRVDGSGIRRALGITLAYPSYRVGIPAALANR